MKIIDKLTNYAAIIGVIATIGGGFYAWGEFNTRLSAIEGNGKSQSTVTSGGHMIEGFVLSWISTNTIHSLVFL